MDIELHSQNGILIAELHNFLLGTPQDVLDVLGSFYPEPVEGVIIHAINLPAEFFQLRTRLAGEILQKFANYRLKIAIVGDFAQYNSQALAAFIYECNRGRDFFFVATRSEALQRLGAIIP